jgi:hypothetical protein
MDLAINGIVEMDAMSKIVTEVAKKLSAINFFIFIKKNIFFIYSLFINFFHI